MSLRTSLKMAFLTEMALLTMAGCGRAAGSGDGEAYGTLRGSIQSSVPDIQGQVRMAIVWANVQNSQAALVSQDVPVAGSFPASFALPLTQLPPAEALGAADPSGKKGFDPSTRAATAMVVVYEDRNANGQLDLVSPNQPAVDRILGALTDNYLVYFEGPVPSAAQADGLTLVDGFNLGVTAQSGPDVQASCEPNCPLKQLRAESTLPLTTPLTIHLTGSDALAMFMCKQPQGFTQTEIPDQTLPPAQATVTCSTDGTAYEYISCSTPSTPCEPQMCTHGWGARAANSVAPAGWPCH